MATFFKTYKKRLALFCAMLLFVFASGYTSINSLKKTVEVKLNERDSTSSEAETITISDASFNKTLRELLEENDLPTSDDYVYGTDLDKKVREVDVLTINKKVSGTITVEGEEIDFDSGADTVGDVIEEYDIKLSPSDAVEPTTDTALASNSSSIRIYRQSKKRETREEAIPFEKTQTSDTSIPTGTTVVDIPGIDGKKRITEDVLYRDGKVISREVVEEEILLEPINQVERVGAGAATPTNPSNNSSPSNNSNSLQRETITPSQALGAAPTVTTGHTTGNLSAEDFDLVCAIVHHESGGSYQGALAVMSCVMNRVDSKNYPNDPVSVLTAPGQFASYTEGHYKNFTGGKSSAETQQAVRDCLAGKRNHSYLNYRSYQTSGSHYIAGCWYF